MVFEWLGSYLCLDAVNTEMVIDGAPTDLWPDFAALLSWLNEADLIAPDSLRIIEAWPGRYKEGVLIAARELRGTVRALCEEVVAEKTVNASTLSQLNNFLARRAIFEELQYVDGKFRVHEWVAVDSLDILVPIARSAARLLSEGDLSLLKKCSNPACILWFYDTTKNKGRRWCSMATCGNRHKAAAHYARRKMEDQP